MSETSVKKNRKTSVSVVPVEQTSLPPVAVNTPDMLLAKAIEKGLDISQLEKLIDLQERWMKNMARNAYIDSFSKFQSEAPELKKNKKVSYEHRNGGGKTEYKYQELADIAKSIREPLANHGLTYRWIQKEDGNEISIACIISHSGGHEEVGEWLKGSPDNSGNKNTIQQKASTITYLKRYTLMNALGLSSGDEDNDGQGGKSDEKQVSKPELKADKLSGAIQEILAGRITVEKIVAERSVTEDQLQALQSAQEKFNATKK